MAAADIASVSVYTARGTAEYVWVEDIADYKAPTRAEIDAGIALTPIVCDHDGWTVKSSQVDAPNLRDRFTPSISGEQKADDSSITTYMSKTGEDARDLMVEDTEGYIIRMPGGDKPLARIDVFPVQVSAQNKMLSIDGSEPDTMEFQFAIKSKPALNLDIPAATP